MKTTMHLLLLSLMVCGPFGLPQSSGVLGQERPELPPSPPHDTREAPDGQHDFDWGFGTWRTELQRLLHPLTDSSTWVEYEGRSVVRRVWDGRANLVELNVEGPTGTLELLSLRLYNPQTRQWSLQSANSVLGIVSPPVVGRFREGRGVFLGQVAIDGRPVYVRFVITPESDRSWRFEQAFSEDGGLTWKVNWIAIDTLIDGEGDDAR